MREKYISVDIEASGPIPGEYSLLTIGACLVDDDSTTFAASLKPLNIAGIRAHPPVPI